jgi:hypothetical protein
LASNFFFAVSALFWLFLSIDRNIHYFYTGRKAQCLKMPIFWGFFVVFFPLPQNQLYADGVQSVYGSQVQVKMAVVLGAGVM